MIGKKTTSLLALGLLLAAFGFPRLSAAQAADRPPEYTDFRNIMRMPDASARLAELEKLRASYPQSSLTPLFESAMIHTKISLTSNLPQVLELQEKILASAEGFERLAALTELGHELLDHPRLADFAAADVAAAVAAYVGQALALADDEKLRDSLSEDQRRSAPYYVEALLMAKALARLLVDDAAGASAALEEYAVRGGRPDSSQAYVLGRIALLEGKESEALEHFLKASLENERDSAARARSLFLKGGGTEAEFAARLEALQKELPFKVQPYRTGPEWKGKAVLVELFTGSECPPCAGADLGVDALLEAFEPKSLAVLVYHLPIPRPDPMMNPASQRRAGRYGVNSTPTIYFDGAAGPRGGGPRAYGEMLYAAYREEVLGRVNAAPATKLGLSAELKGDDVVVSYSLDKAPPGVEFHLALVQDEEKYAGANGILFHHMVVKEFITLEAAPAAKGSLKINLAAAEAAAVKFISDFEQSRRFAFRERHTAIKRSGLRVVFIAQDKNSLQVHNAVVAAVK